MEVKKLSSFWTHPNKYAQHPNNQKPYWNKRMNHLPEMQRKMKWFYLQMPQSPSVMTMFISSFLCIIASVLIQAGGYISTAFHSLVWWFKLQTPACHHLKKIKMLPVKNLIQSHHQSNAPSQEFIKSLLFFINLKKTDCSSFHHTHRERERVYNSKQIRLWTSSKIPC